LYPRKDIALGRTPIHISMARMDIDASRYVY
jgi:hypothetical protein